MLASQKLYVLEKLDSAPLPAVQTFPQRVNVVYGSRDACTTSISQMLTVKRDNNIISDMVELRHIRQKNL